MLQPPPPSLPFICCLDSRAAEVHPPPLPLIHLGSRAAELQPPPPFPYSLDICLTVPNCTTPPFGPFPLSLSLSADVHPPSFTYVPTTWVATPPPFPIPMTPMANYISRRRWAVAAVAVAVIWRWRWQLFYSGHGGGGGGMAVVQSWGVFSC